MYDRLLRVRPEPCSGVKIEPYPGEPIDSIYRRFKKIVERSGIIPDYRRRQHFVPKSERRRIKSMVARKRRGS